MQDGIFVVRLISFPPPESKSATLQALPAIDFFGKPQPSQLKVVFSSHIGFGIIKPVERPSCGIMKRFVKRKS